MKKTLVVLISLFTFFALYAQNGSDDYGTKAKKRPFWAVKYNKLCDKYNALLFKYQQLDSRFHDTLNYYEERDSAFVEASRKFEEDRDSIQPTLDQIRLDKESIAEEKARLEKQLENCDWAIARYCDLRLQQQYKKVAVEKALEMWNTITSPDVKEVYLGVDDMLKNYYRYYNEVRTVIQEAQNSQFRYDTSPLSTFKKDMKDKMMKTEYFRNWDDNNKIKFLDQQKDIFFYCLDHQERGKYDFSLILEKLFPNVDDKQKK